MFRFDSCSHFSPCKPSTKWQGFQTMHVHRYPGFPTNCPKLKSICSFCMESMCEWLWNYWNWNIWCVQCWILYDLLWRWCHSVSRGNFVVQAWSHILSKFAPQYIYQAFLWQMGRQEIDIVGGIKGFVWAPSVFCECLVLLSWLAGLWWWGLDHVAGTSYPSGKLLRLSNFVVALSVFRSYNV